MPQYRGKCAQCNCSRLHFTGGRGYNVSIWPDIHFPHQSILNTKICSPCHHNLIDNKLTLPHSPVIRSIPIRPSSAPPLTNLININSTYHTSSNADSAHVNFPAVLTSSAVASVDILSTSTEPPLSDLINSDSTNHTSVNNQPIQISSSIVTSSTIASIDRPSTQRSKRKHIQPSADIVIESVPVNLPKLSLEAAEQNDIQPAHLTCTNVEQIDIQAVQPPRKRAKRSVLQSSKQTYIQHQSHHIKHF